MEKMMCQQQVFIQKSPGVELPPLDLCYPNDIHQAHTAIQHLKCGYSKWGCAIHAKYIGFKDLVQKESKTAHQYFYIDMINYF